MKITAALLVLSSCTMPDAYHVTTGYGVSEFDRPVTEFDTMAIGFGVSWYPGAESRHQESLSATRRLEIAMVTGKVQPMPITINHPDPAADEPEGLADAFTEKPKTVSEALILLIAAGALVLLAGALWIARRAGLHLPGFAKRETPTEDA